MIQALLPGAIAFTMLTSQASPAPLLAPVPLASPEANLQKSVFLVKTEDTLKSIAKKYYGDEKFWTTLWNDNEQVKDPEHVRSGTLLTIRTRTLQEPEEISPRIKASYPELFPTPTPEQIVIPVIQAASVSALVSSDITPSPTQTPTSPSVLTEAQITFLGNCEAGMNPTRNSGNGYYGAFQFSYGTWKSMGTGYERADLAPIEVQKDAVQRLLARSSIFTQFPACARAMQASGLL